MWTLKIDNIDGIEKKYLRKIHENGSITTKQITEEEYLEWLAEGNTPEAAD